MWYSSAKLIWISVSVKDSELSSHIFPQSWGQLNLTSYARASKIKDKMSTTSIKNDLVYWKKTIKSISKTRSGLIILYLLKKNPSFKRLYKLLVQHQNLQNLFLTELHLFLIWGPPWMRQLWRFWKKIYNKGDNLITLANIPWVRLRGNNQENDNILLFFFKKRYRA